jgi:hypothetical protein
MLKYHGRETRDLKKQEYYADALVRCGPRALPCLCSEIKQSSVGFRYSPDAYDLVRRIQGGRAFLEKRIVECSTLEKLNVMYGLLHMFEDWSYLLPFIEAYDQLPDSEPQKRVVRVRVSRLLQEKLPHAPPFVVTGPGVNPEFREWAARGGVNS